MNNMQKLSLISLLFICVSSVFSQDIKYPISDKRYGVQKKVIERLEADRISMEHFYLVGRMRCYKALGLSNDSKVDYDVRWLRGGMLNFPLMSLVEPQKIIDYFDKDMISRIKMKKRELSKRAEKFYTSPYNGMLVCESLHRLSDENIKKYKKFINDVDNYRDYDVYEHYYKKYLENVTINNDYW